MKVSHFITYDRGQGPVSFVEITTDERSLMLRVNHKARFNKTAEVEVEAVKKALAQETDLGEASSLVPSSVREELTDAVLFWIDQNGHSQRYLSWKNTGEAILFEREADMDAWKMTEAFEPLESDTPKKRKMIMG